MVVKTNSHVKCVNRSLKSWILDLFFIFFWIYENLGFMSLQCLYKVSIPGISVRKISFSLKHKCGSNSVNLNQPSARLLFFTPSKRFQTLMSQHQTLKKYLIENFFIIPLLKWVFSLGQH